MSDRNFDGKVPEPGELTENDQEIIDLGGKTLMKVGQHIEAVELRAGLRAALDAAGEVNAYLNATEPWNVLKEDAERGGTILWVAIQAISAIRVALSPYLVFSTSTIGEMLGINSEVSGWHEVVVPGGTVLGDIAPVFTKLDHDVLDDTDV